MTYFILVSSQAPNDYVAGDTSAFAGTDQSLTAALVARCRQVLQFLRGIGRGV